MQHGMLCKHEDLSLTHTTHVKKNPENKKMVVVACNDPINGEVETRAFLGLVSYLA